MIRRRDTLLFCGCCGALASSELFAEQAQYRRLGPFTPDQLERARVAYEPGVRGLFYRDLLARLPPAQRAALGEIRLEMPTTEQRNSALDIGANPDTRTVVFPVRTLLFVQQHAGLCAQFVRLGCPVIQPMLYATMLVVRNEPVSFRPPGPLEAFGLDEGIYRDPILKDMADKTATSTVFFLLAHELGHLYHRHRIRPAGPASQDQEREADTFAIRASAHIGVFVLSLITFFLTAAMMEEGQTTHPMSGARLEAIAREVEARPDSFLDPLRDQARFTVPARELAGQIRATAAQIDQGPIRSQFRYLAGITDWRGLREDFARLQRIGACRA